MIPITTSEQAIEVGSHLRLCEAYQLLQARKNALKKSAYALSIMRTFDRQDKEYKQFFNLASHYATEAQLYREAIQAFLGTVKN